MSRRSTLLALLLAGLTSAAALAQADAGATAQAAPGGVPAPKGKAETCATCHAGLAGKLAAPVELLKAKDVHGARGLGCASCHGGDATAAAAADSHKGMVAKPPTQEATAAMCGRCHAGPAENFLKSPHHLAKDHARRPDCATCHGAHGVQAASIDLVGEPLCSQCHSISQARRIAKAVGDAEREVGKLDGQLSFMGDKAGREQLLATRHELRGLTHALNLFEITRTAAHALEVVDQVRAKSAPLQGALAWANRLRNGAIAVGSLVLITLVLWIARFIWRRRHHLPAVAMPKSGALKVVLGIAFLVLIGSLIGAKKGFDYIEHDPKFCTSCHTMGSAYELWEKSGHKNIECHTCHLADPIDNLHQLWVYSTRRPDEVVKHAQIDRSVCEKCHTGDGGKSKWSNIVETPGHRVHAQKAKVECVQCHGQSVHKFKPSKETCAICHKQITLTAAGTMSEMHCLQCHNFTVADAKRPLRPDRAACLECHEQRKVMDETFPEKAPMKWDCGKCHKPHEKIALVKDDCLKCHFGVDEGIHKVKAHASSACLDCHRPHGWNTQPETCRTCHKGLERHDHKHGTAKTCGACHGASDP